VKYTVTSETSIWLSSGEKYNEQQSGNIHKHDRKKHEDDDEETRKDKEEFDYIVMRAQDILLPHPVALDCGVFKFAEKLEDGPRDTLLRAGGERLGWRGFRRGVAFGGNAHGHLGLL
jgi:hypothetical protein